jgi:hypothetical protein
MAARRSSACMARIHLAGVAPLTIRRAASADPVTRIDWRRTTHRRRVLVEDDQPETVAALIDACSQSHEIRRHLSQWVDPASRQLPAPATPRGIGSVMVDHAFAG